MSSRFNGPRGAGLFCAGVVCLLRGLFLLPLSEAPPAMAPSGIESLTAGWEPAILIYIFAWFGAGAAAIVGAFRQRDAAACAAVFGLCAVWGVGYLVAGLDMWATGHRYDTFWFGLDYARREWQSAASYLGLALLGGYWSRMVNPSRLQLEAQEREVE